ncbi:PD-(D/E)XK nuclease family protein, partial [candidate division WOR-3 bacterium]|nr:PD-(D/E)XK nuclease family protein [candidate division WOR-3 bacterium]
LPTATALSSPWLPGLLRLPGESGPGPRDRAAAALDHLSRRAGIIKGRTDWEHIRARLESAERRLPEEMAGFLDDVQDRVRRAIGLAERILEPADTLGRQAARLKQFLEAVDFCRDEPDFGSDRGSFYDLLDALHGFDADFGAEPEPRAGFVRALEYLVGLCPSRAEPAPAGVLVVRLDESIGLHPRRVVCAGLTETNLPGGYRSDPIIPERLLRRLGMPGMDRHRDWQRFHLRRTVESARSELFLSFHDSADGKPVLPTPFLELEPVAPGPVEVFYSPLEDQLARGRNKGKPFAETTRTVDFTGDLEVRAALERRFGPDRPVSVTGIESYRHCPYRFYLERVLGLDSPPEPQYEVDAAQWGTVIHRCLDLLYEKGPAPLSRLEERARAALDRALRDSGLPPFWAETTRRVFDNFLPAFARIERGLREEGYSPKWTERRLEGPVADGVSVKGRLDRVDESSTALRVLDYKTGAAGISAKQVLEDRTHVQLPLYCRLVQDETGRPVDNCGVYSTRDARVRWLAGKEHSLDELVRAALDATVEAVAAIRSGEFPSRAADPRACEKCDYAYLCAPDKGRED